MRSFQSRLGEFDARGVRVVAISVDPPPVSQDYRQKIGVSFPLLSDVDAQVTKSYDLFHAAGAPDKSDIARPAEFLIDSTGTVRWKNLTESAIVRARPEEVLKAIDAMSGTAAR